ncbi:MAG: hypothetical protein JO336_19355 [Acidobacteriia bacterium]|nr:hypothetical protein [Terriglobia bacterium]
MPKIAVFGVCVALLIVGPLVAEEAFAGETAKPVEVTKTEHMDFPSGGVLRLNNVIGVLTIEPWDQPGLELTTTKTTLEEYDAANRQKGVAILDNVRLTSERHGDELVLTNDFPRYGSLKPPLPGSPRFTQDMHIFVPRSVRLEIHGSGQIYIDEIAGNIQADISQGTILLHLPEQGHYDIDARSKFGTVNSDFPGQEKRSWWLVGHSFMDQPAAGAQKLHLRTGYGDIILLKIRQPQAPPPAVKPES